MNKSYLKSIHYKIGDKIYKLLNYRNHNNILLYGNKSCGKTYLILSLLNDLSIYDFKEENNDDYYVKIYSNHYYFDCKILYNKINFINYIKEIIQSYDYYNDKIKYIVIDSYELLSDNLQDCLKVIMEKSFETTRFIFITNTISKVNKAIQSRSMLIKIPEPTINDKFIYMKKNNYIHNNDFLLYEDCKKYKLIVLLNKTSKYKCKLSYYSDMIINILQNKFNLRCINKIKLLSCEIKSIDIPITELLKVLLNKLIKISNNYSEIIKIISNYQHNLIFSYREIIYIESLIINLHKVINNI